MADCMSGEASAADTARAAAIDIQSCKHDAAGAMRALVEYLPLALAVREIMRMRALAECGSLTMPLLEQLGLAARSGCVVSGDTLAEAAANGLKCALIYAAQFGEGGDPEGKKRAQALLALIVAGNLGVFIAVRWQSGPSLEPLAAGVVTFLSIAFAFDVFRGEATTDRPLTATVALLPLPLLVAGPIVRYHDFRAQLANPHVGMGPFTYGVRRVATGVLKITLVASVLGATP